ncbi:C2 domain-containing protein [Artemisia annua]|uniref:C2 domain-containing protein n=1 Tax=Artemisia annua TaxID=35608 RepID=A0A2U1P2E4_ARTAN|nr:C2 domain-containing protein [Artemisia annua]
MKEMDRYRCTLRPETVEALYCAKDWLRSETFENVDSVYFTLDSGSFVNDMSLVFTQMHVHGPIIHLISTTDVDKCWESEENNVPRSMHDGLKKPNSIKKADKVYADVSILGTDKKLRTPVNQTGGSEPTWNHRMKFTMDEDLAQQNRLTLVVKIKAVRIFTHKNLGEVCVPIKELMEGIKDEGKDMQALVKECYIAICVSRTQMRSCVH